MSIPNSETFDTQAFNDKLSAIWPVVRGHVGFRYPALDCFEADEVTQDVMMEFYRYACRQYLLLGNHKPVECPDEYKPLILGTILPQKAIDAIRKKRRGPDQLDSDNSGALYENSIESRDRSVEAVQAADYAQHLPEFFRRISKQGILEPLRRIVRERGAKALDDEFIFLHEYLFDYKSLGNHEKRASITEELCANSGKTRTAVDVALLRLRAAWRKALSVFRDGGTGGSATRNSRSPIHPGSHPPLTRPPAAASFVIR